MRATPPGSAGRSPASGSIELATVIMGPFGAQLLGDLGAEVDQGRDRRRRRQPRDGRRTAPRAQRHRPQPAPQQALDRHRPQGAARAGGRCCALLADADVLITNLRPGPLRRLGLDHESLRDEFPRLVYCQAQGFRTSSDEADLPAYDDIIQALTGFPQLNSMGFGAMHFVPSTVADKVAGMFIAQGVLAALVARSVTGEGQRVEVPMFDAALAFNLVEHLSRAAVAGEPPGYNRVPDGAPRPAPHERRLGGDAAVHRRPLDGAVRGRRRGAAARARVVRRPPHPPRPRRRGVRAAGVDPRAQDDGRVGRARHRARHPGVASCRRCRRSSTTRRNHRGVLRDAEHPVVGPFRSIAAARRVLGVRAARAGAGAARRRAHRRRSSPSSGSTPTRSPRSSPTASCAAPRRRWSTARVGGRPRPARRRRRGGARCRGRRYVARAISEALIGSVISCRSGRRDRRRDVVRASAARTPSRRRRARRRSSTPWSAPASAPARRGSARRRPPTAGSSTAPSSVMASPITRRAPR